MSTFSVSTSNFKSSPGLSEFQSNFSLIFPEQLDKTGNRLQLGETEKGELCATVIDTHGKITFLAPSRVINPLGNGFTSQAIQYIKSHPFSFDLVYLNQKLTIWPHLIAAGKDELVTTTAIANITGSGEWSPPQIPDERVTLGHIFRKASGHFSIDTPENRAFILAAVAREENRVGIDAFGKELYLKVMPDGTQAWAHVENGIITNGGCNLSPLKWVANSSLKEGRKLVPFFANVHLRDAGGFVQRVLLNRLASTYNASQGRRLIQPHPSEIPSLPASSSSSQSRSGTKGVEHCTGLILNLLEELKIPELPSEHLFFLPTSEHGAFLEEAEVRQILRELAIGIYLYDAFPFISIHFNQEMKLYPVIHPAYQDTMIGHMIGMLDYYMKGFCHGQLFEDDFIQTWDQNPILGEQALREKCIDFQAYCKQQLGISFQTFEEIFSMLEQQQSSSSTDQKVQREDFGISYRIVAKQNAIRRAGPLFTIDGAFDVEYSVDRLPSSPAQRRICEQACEIMAKQIKEILPRLPKAEKLFHFLHLTNFFAYYFNTLKEANKIPHFSRDFSPDTSKVCPSLFPPLPKSRESEMSFKPSLLIQNMLPEQAAMLLRYLQHDRSMDLEQRVVGILRDSLQRHILHQNPVQLSEETYSSLASTLLDAFKGRYEATRRSAESTMVAMGIKNHPSEQLSEREIGLRMDRLLQKLDKDIADTSAIIQTKMRRGILSSEELRWVSDWQKGKQDIVRYKPLLQKWARDPLTAISEGATLSLNLSTRVLKVKKEDGNGNISVAGGLGLHIHDEIAQEDPRAFALMENHGDSLAALPFEKLMRLEESSAAFRPGMIFKLSFDEFDPGEIDRRHAAVGYLIAPSQEYVLTEELLTLCHAISTEDEGLFIRTAEHIENWNFQDTLKVKLIHYAASAENPLFLREVIRRGADPFAVDAQGLTALHYAVKNGRIDCAHFLLSHAPSLLNAQNHNGETPLFMAAYNQQVESVRFLIHAKADPNVTTKHGMNVLICALHQGNEIITGELIGSGLVNLEHRLLDGRTAVHFAIEMRLGKSLQMLLEQGVNGNQALKNGYKPIHLAIIQGWLQGVKLLATTPGIILDAPLSSGQMPIELATTMGHVEIAHFLRGDVSTEAPIKWEDVSLQLETALIRNVDVEKTFSLLENLNKAFAEKILGHTYFLFVQKLKEPFIYADFGKKAFLGLEEIRLHGKSLTITTIDRCEALKRATVEQLLLNCLSALHPQENLAALKEALDHLDKIDNHRFRNTLHGHMWRVLESYGAARHWPDAGRVALIHSNGAYSQTSHKVEAIQAYLDELRKSWRN